MVHSRLVAIALIAVALAGCNTAGLVCGPPLKHYTVADMQRAKRQYTAAVARGDSEMILRLVDDYGIERDAIRACLKRRK